MKIALVDPPFTLEEYVGGTTKGMKKVMNVIPSLGPAYLAAYLEEHGLDVKIYDCSLRMTGADLIRVLGEEKPQLVGLTCTTPKFMSALVTAQEIKRTLPETTVVIGGPHVTAAPKKTMEHDCFDIGVLCEGEITFLELVEALNGSGTADMEGILGLVFRRDGETVFSPRRPFIKDLDSLPFPARHLLPPLSAYRPTPASYTRLPLGVIISSRGCPTQCTFCDRAVFGTRYRMRSADNVLDEVEELIGKCGAREIRFFDDSFTLNRKRVFEICDKMDERGIRIPWTCLTKANSVTREMLKRMRGAGCWQILYGLESGDPGMLRRLKKGVTLEENEQAVRWAQEVGMSVRADFIVGTPGETMESLERTLKFAIDMRLDYAHFNKFVPFPGTELYHQLVAQGYTFDFTESWALKDHSHLHYVPDGMSKDEFLTWLNKAFRRFYLRPSYILRRLCSIRSFDELIGQVRGFLGMSQM